MNPVLTTGAAAQLQDGVNLVLSRWAALQKAVEDEWWGRDTRQKSQQLGDILCHLLIQSKEQVYIEDVEDMIDDFMLSHETVVEDGSIEEIAEQLMLMREECLEGRFDSIKQLKETNAPSASFSRQPDPNDGEDSEDDEDDAVEENNSSGMEIDAPQCSPNQNNQVTNEPNLNEVPEVDDGWTQVAPRRHRGRRN